MNSVVKALRETPLPGFIASLSGIGITQAWYALYAFKDCYTDGSANQKDKE